MLAAAEELQVPMPVASLIRDRFLTLLARGGADLDWSAIGALAAWEAGAAIRPAASSDTTPRRPSAPNTGSSIAE